MTSVERVKQILKERGIKMAPFEKQCGFSNGYIGKLKEGFPDERLFIVADLLKILSDTYGKKCAIMCI